MADQSRQFIVKGTGAEEALRSNTPLENMIKIMF
jgi:hypothetical protein